MEISLIRHGRSKYKENRKMKSDEFRVWIEHYDKSGIFEEKEVPESTVEKIKTAGVVITSDLRRSVESAAMLVPDCQAIQNPIFRETELPYLNLLAMKNVRLNPRIWAVLLRCLWFSGFSRECESIIHARRRAEEAARILIHHAKANTSAALVGHGFFNILIGKELHKEGWVMQGKRSNKHWSCTTYRKYTTFSSS